MKKFTKITSLVVAAIAGLVAWSCDPEDITNPYKDDVIAVMSALQDENDWKVINLDASGSFNYASGTAISGYAWELLDANAEPLATANGLNATVSVTEAGNYTINLTVTNGVSSRTASKAIYIADPNDIGPIIYGSPEEGERTWQLLWEDGVATVGIYGADGAEWWALGTATSVADRPCAVNDEYTFVRPAAGQTGGAFIHDSKGDYFLDANANGGHMDDTFAEGCHGEDETALHTNVDGADVSAWMRDGSENFTYVVENQQIVLSGDGVYLGLLKFSNNGDTRVPVSTLAWDIVETIEVENGVDTMRLNLAGTDGFNWTLTMVHYDDLSLRPALPGTDTGGGGGGGGQIDTVEVIDSSFKQLSVQALFDGFDNRGTMNWLTDQITTFDQAAANPDPDAENNSAVVGQYVKGEGTTENIQFHLPYYHDFSTHAKFRLRVYAPSTNDYVTPATFTESWSTVSTLQRTVTLRFYDHKNGSPWETQIQESLVVDTDDAWVTLEFDLSDEFAASPFAAGSEYSIGIIQIGGEGHNAQGSWYIDDFSLLNEDGTGEYRIFGGGGQHTSLR